ncbi:MAG: DUF1538 domain-containing protein [Pirellula sp.]|nr:DUF1538 domain-containing protein [Pirellula sp.]
MSDPNVQQSAIRTLGFGGVLSILWRYFREKAVEQLRSVWFIIVYLLLFQIFLLQLPVIYGVTIALGLLFVIIGLTFFMEGLRLGLMPFGETIGAILPRNSKLPLILAFAFLLGLGATFAEPAISVLKKAGSEVKPDQAPLLYSLLNDFSGELVLSVGVGVGVAVALGILRFFLGWSLKRFIVPLVTGLIGLTIYACTDPLLAPVIGLAWDCGAVTTGPVTVPLVLALGIGVCRIISNDRSQSSGGADAGFGIVTLASLLPIFAVLMLALYHQLADDYYGGKAYRGELIQAAQSATSKLETTVEANHDHEQPKFSDAEFREYLEKRKLPGDARGYNTYYAGGEVVLENGRIIHRNAEIVVEKVDDSGVIESFVISQTRRPWDGSLELGQELLSALRVSAQAILPLCVFMFVTLLVILKERLRQGDEIALGVSFSVIGMTMFSLGLSMGLTPLGTQLGSNIPVTFASIVPWGGSGAVPAVFENPIVGKLVTMLFAFFLGYGATLAEPALNAMGETVEDVTVGVFKKRLLMHVVAIGVGLGPYVLLIILTIISSDEFVNFAWDGAGVTTGPITVPLVLAMGLGIGSKVPGVIDGFGILALASVGPILTVLLVGLVVQRTRRNEFSVVTDEIV